MAGTDSNFDPALFREKIKLAMNIGLPNATALRATFRWKDVKDYTVEDPKGKPYDFSATPTATTTHADVQVDCAVEFTPAVNSFYPSGQSNQSRAVITLLDSDYTSVSTANYVILGENTYVIDYWAPPLGLFEVTIYQCYLSARDES